MAIRIPFAYQEVEYIESTGTQWFDTGVIPSGTNYTVEIAFQATQVNSSASWIISAWCGSQDSSFRAGFSSGNFNTTNGFGYSQTSDKLAYTVATGKSRNSTLSLYMFGQHESTGAAHVANSLYKLYYCKIYKDGTLIRDFVPCYRKEGGMAGLYDAVNYAFFMNNGTGSFVVGADVNRVDRKFQPGIVGKTNVVEGALIPDTHEQLVNYTMIYHLGDECEELTGGFGGCTGYRSTGYSGSAPTVTKNADHIHITHSASNTLGSMLTANKIDLTDFARLAAYAYSNTSGNTYAWANASYISARSGSGLSGGGVSLSSNATFTGWKTLDLTSVTGEYYLGTEHYWYGVAQTNRLYCMALFNGDDYNTLCDLAGVSTFATVDALIADTNAISTILSKQNAVNFMAKQCTGDFMAAFLASADCLSLLESSPYKNTIKNNEHWAKFLDLVA